MKKATILLFLLIMTSVDTLHAQDLEKNIERRLNDFFASYTTTAASIGKTRAERFEVDYDRKTLSVFVSESFAYQPFLPETVEGIYRQLTQLLPGPVCYFQITLYAGGKAIESLIPNLYRKRKEMDKSRLSPSDKNGSKAAWVTNTSRPYQAPSGLEGRHIALWQSHGKYFKNDQKEWAWQRPRLFCTTEDLYTQSYIIPYIIPMLEHAGAVVYTPRERDTQRNEVIVDNDNLRSGSLYIEGKSRKARWNTPDVTAFAHTKPFYADNENPFTQGTARYAQTEKKKFKAFAEWIPTIPETGDYAVYVSYQTLPQSISDAKYTVFHKGGTTEFKVNQQIGGGTWVYLGTFAFDKGNNDYGMVVLSNESKEKGVVCADAVRFGGGMGNIVRGKKTSDLPRYLEAARYSSQWAGMPYAVYGGKEGKNDYYDDINTRPQTINYLSGGSTYNPTQKGLGIPFELTMGLHTDAGYSKEDKIIGSLGIYTSESNDGKLATGTSRLASRDLIDITLTNLKRDIPTLFDTDWTRRGLWDKNYSETRQPAVPSMILELLSHQNFADMQLGHDPNFRFTAGRSIYKSIVRFVNGQHGQETIIQPLPINHFAIQPEKKNRITLSWQPVNDPLEPTAKPREYILYTRIGYGGFDNGVKVSGTSHRLKLEEGLVYSFKVTAINKGGESFPSEILSAYQAKRSKGTLLIVNGFDRLSAPAIVNTSTHAGFDLDQDPGVDYLYNISLSGRQLTFDRQAGGKEGKGALGNSSHELEGMKIAGNTFDYPFVHGKAIQAVGGYSFVSCSDEAVENGTVNLGDYPVVDLLLGLEKANPSQRDNQSYKTFSPVLQAKIEAYCRQGGSIFVSGSYLGSDMIQPQEAAFTANVLKYTWGQSIGNASVNTIQGAGRTFNIPRTLNEKSYTVSAPECLQPVSPAFTAYTYTASNLSAGIAYEGDYRTFVLGFPFESITSETERANVMAGALRFLTQPSGR